MGRNNATIIFLAIAALLTLGMVMLTSTSVWMDELGGYSLVKMQAVWIALGLVSAAFISSYDYRKLREFWVPLLAFSCVLLIMCYLPGISKTTNGESRWLDIPGLPVFQPSEIAKIFVIMGLAGWYTHYQTEVRSFWKGFIFPGLLMGIPVLLIFFEKDMGTAAALGMAGVVVVYVAGARMIFIAPACITAFSGMALVVWKNPERMGRVMALFDLESDKYKYGDGFQQLHSLYAFANGGIDGMGLGNGVEKLGYIAYVHADFILPAIGEELGIRFTLGIVFCFVLILVYGISIAMHAKDTFGRLMAVGLTFIIVTPAMMNIGVCTAVLPNTGLPLPFISYGGTNMFFTLMAVGLLASIHRHTLYVKRSELPVINDKKQNIRI